MHGREATQLRVGIASHYDVHPMVYNGLCWEAVQVLAEVSSGHILAPRASAPSAWDKTLSKGVRWLGFPPPTYIAPIEMPECDLLFYVAMLPKHLPHLQAIRQWRERSKKVAVFLFETWSSQAEANRPYYKLLDEVDHVFLFNAPSVAAVQRVTAAPCSFLPAATDCLAAAPAPTSGERPIDVYGMGRNFAPVHAQLLEMAQRGELFYQWDAGAAQLLDGYRVARFRTQDLFRRSRLFLAFGFDQGSKTREAAGEQAIPARVFEGTAGGAVMLGTAPRSPEFRELFDWPDAIFEIPADEYDVGTVYAGLDPERVEQAGRRAAVESLRRHDWAHRWRSILAQLGLPEDAALHERLDRLERRAQAVEAAVVRKHDQPT